MSFVVACPDCGSRFSVKNEKEEKAVRCPECDEKFVASRKATARPQAPAANRGKLKLILGGIAGLVVIVVTIVLIIAKLEDAAKERAVAFHGKMRMTFAGVEKNRSVFVAELRHFLNPPTKDMFGFPVKPPDPGKAIPAIKSRFGEFETTMKSAAVEIASWTVPSPERHLHDKFTRVFKLLEDSMPKYRSAIAVCENKSLSEDQRNQAMQILVGIETAEKSSFKELADAEREFGQRYGLIMLPNVQSGF